MLKSSQYRAEEGLCLGEINKTLTHMMGLCELLTVPDIKDDSSCFFSPQAVSHHLLSIISRLALSLCGESQPPTKAADETVNHLVFCT